MNQPAPYEQLLSLLHELGVRTVDDRTSGGQPGFPLSVPLVTGATLVLDLPNPGPLASLDPEALGVAILDPLGYVRRTWGLARRIPLFRGAQSVLESQLGGLLEGTYGGSSGAIYLDGYRYFSGNLANGEGSDIFILVVNAQEERQAKRQASKSWRTANALKRLGKALTMNQTMHPLCTSASHEIASAAELAAVLLWTYNSEENVLDLTASVGANRQGTMVLNKLAVAGGSSCVAELVADTREQFFQSDVAEHIATASLEAKFCYLKPKGISVHPLVISDRLLGVLELVGRDGDTHFEENLELFETIAEHLALALNSAILFENFEKWATHDALTGVANHRHLHEFLQQRISEAARTGQEIGVIMMDVDHFRSFNEEEGHDAGDEVLKLVSDAIKSCIRPYDLAARYGGEEFTVVMPGSSRATTWAVAERIRSQVQEMSYVTRTGRERHVTVSLGCALHPDSGNETATLLKSADVALFEAKRAGRNRVVFFDGKYEPKSKVDGFNLEGLIKRLPEQDRGESQHLIGLLDPMIARLAETLPLSSPQTSILRGLVWSLPTYRRLCETGTPAELKAFESGEHGRVLAPSLHALSERFDGTGERGTKGTRIPLLARVLAVLWALTQDKGEALMQDPGRFDPEMVVLVTNLERAA